MTVHRVSDKASNANENLERAVEVIGGSGVRRAVFVAVHTGRKSSRTVDELAKLIGKGRQVTLNAATRLANEGLIHRSKEGNSVSYQKDPFYQANRDRVLRLIDQPKLLAAMPTKRRPAAGTTILQVPVRQSKIDAKFITIDDVQSFSKVRKIKEAPEVHLREEATKLGILDILKERGTFKDWGGERNDFLTDKLRVGGSRRMSAFALKGPSKTGVLTPGKMGKNGDQIQRLARSPAHVLFVQYHGQIGDSVREQLETFAQLKSVMEGRKVWYGLIDGADTARLVAAYPGSF